MWVVLLIFYSNRSRKPGIYIYKRFDKSGSSHARLVLTILVLNEYCGILLREEDSICRSNESVKRQRKPL